MKNAKKPKSNLSRISIVLHITIFEFLEIKQIFAASAVCRSLYRASQDNAIWDKHLPNQRRLLEFCQKYGSKPNGRPNGTSQASKGLSGSLLNQPGQIITKRDLYLNDMKVIQNMTVKKRYQNYDLDGHTD